jgi:hypothetical protein
MIGLTDVVKATLFAAFVKKKTVPHHPTKCHWGLEFSLEKKCHIFLFLVPLQNSATHDTELPL